MDLAELKRQRALIAQHLQWLDEKIAQAEHQDVPSIGSTQEAPLRTPASAQANSALPSASPLSHEAPLPETLSAFNKMGCWLVGLALIALTLFLILGLPYLLY